MCFNMKLFSNLFSNINISNNSFFSGNKALTAEAQIEANMNNTINFSSNSNFNVNNEVKETNNYNKMSKDLLLNYYTSVDSIKKDLCTDPKYLSYNLSGLKEIMIQLKSKHLENYYLELNYNTQKFKRYIMRFKDILFIFNERKDLSINKRIRLACIKSSYKQKDLNKKINVFNKRRISIDKFINDLDNKLMFFENEFNKKTFKLKVIKLYEVKK